MPTAAAAWLVVLAIRWLEIIPAFMLFRALFSFEPI